MRDGTTGSCCSHKLKHTAVSNSALRPSKESRTRLLLQSLTFSSLGIKTVLIYIGLFCTLRDTLCANILKYINPDIMVDDYLYYFKSRCNWKRDIYIYYNLILAIVNPIDTNTTSVFYYYFCRSVRTSSGRGCKYYINRNCTWRCSNGNTQTWRRKIITKERIVWELWLYLCGWDCYWLTGTTAWCHPNSFHPCHT